MTDHFKKYCELYTQYIHTTLGQIDPIDIEAFIKNLLGYKRIFLTGRGRTCLILQTFAMRLVHLGKSANMIGLPITPRITNNDCLLIASGSGKTDGLVLIAEKAKREGVCIFVISYQETSVLADMADHVLILPLSDDLKEGQNGNKVLFGTVFEQALFLTLESMVGVMMKLEGQTFNDMTNRHVLLE